MISLNSMIKIQMSDFEFHSAAVRGFILFRTGFLGGLIISIVPPVALRALRREMSAAAATKVFELFSAD